MDVFASRDLDSRISAREVAAVSEWQENSTEPIHSMRDHPAHFTSLLGASWDTDLTRKNARSRWKRVWVKMLNDTLSYAGRGESGPDQLLLNEYVKFRISKLYAIQNKNISSIKLIFPIKFLIFISLSGTSGKDLENGWRCSMMHIYVQIGLVVSAGQLKDSWSQIIMLLRLFRIIILLFIGVQKSVGEILNGNIVDKFRCELIASIQNLSH